MIKILFVCLGNICRSPLAEAIFMDKIKKKGLLDAFEVDSAGTGDWHVGADPDPRSVAVALENNIQINSIGRQISVDDRHFDYILAMDSNNHRDIIEVIEPGHEGLYLMRHFDDHEKNADVPDPYYGGDDGFSHVFNILNRSCDNLIDFIVQKHNLNAT